MNNNEIKIKENRLFQQICIIKRQKNLQIEKNKLKVENPTLKVEEVVIAQIMDNFNGHDIAQ